MDKEYLSGKVREIQRGVEGDRWHENFTDGNQCKIHSFQSRSV